MLRYIHIGMEDSHNFDAVLRWSVEHQMVTNGMASKVKFQVVSQSANLRPTRQFGECRHELKEIGLGLRCAPGFSCVALDFTKIILSCFR